MTNYIQRQTYSILDTPPARTGFLARLIIAGANLYTLLLIAYLLLRVLAGDRWWWLALLHNGAPYYFAPLVVLLPLTLLARARRAAGRLVLLGLVGALWFGPLWLPRPAPAPAEGTRIDLISFNIAPGVERLDEIADWLIEADAALVLIQELPPTRADQLRAALRATYPYVGDAPDLPPFVLSRFPVESVEAVPLGEAWWVERVVVDVEGRALALYNVHLAMPLLDAPRIDAPNPLTLMLAYDETRRNAQIRALLDHLAAEPLPFIVAGDFNTSDHSPIYDELAAALGDAYRAVAPGLGRTWPAGPVEEGIPALVPRLLRLDYAFHGDGLRPLNAALGPGFGSDHLPLRVAFDFE